MLANSSPAACLLLPAASHSAAAARRRFDSSRAHSLTTSCTRAGTPADARSIDSAGTSLDVADVRPSDVVDAVETERGEPAVAVTANVHTINELGQLRVSFGLAEQSKQQDRIGIRSRPPTPASAAIDSS